VKGFRKTTADARAAARDENDIANELHAAILSHLAERAHQKIGHDGPGQSG
jgi:hypothetical protein